MKRDMNIVAVNFGIFLIIRNFVGKNNVNGFEDNKHFASKSFKVLLRKKCIHKKIVQDTK